MTQVFPYGGVETMHPKKGSFKVNAQRLKPYFGVEFLCKQAGHQLMSQKLIEFLVHFPDCSYNVIACFYVEICTIYQIYILQKLLVEMKIPARIRSENSSMAR